VFGRGAVARAHYRAGPHPWWTLYHAGTTRNEPSSRPVPVWVAVAIGGVMLLYLIFRVVAAHIAAG